VLYGIDAHLDVFEREIMADVAALQVHADAEGLEIRARIREETVAIVQLLPDGLRQLGPETAPFRPAAVSQCRSALSEVDGFTAAKGAQCESSRCDLPM
jgi:hypothetical protein